ncbi:MAG TPA: hypothetical protein VG795_00910 [Acidimicrobiia bacterium]|nr:hypothetical protein [Acidimicrobiia bacterium]
MLALAGFALGYVLGAREGREGLERMIASTRQVLASDEFKAALETAQSLAGGVLKQSLERLGGAAASETRSFASRLRAA